MLSAVGQIRIGTVIQLRKSIQSARRACPKRKAWRPISTSMGHMFEQLRAIECHDIADSRETIEHRSNTCDHCAAQIISSQLISLPAASWTVEASMSINCDATRIRPSPGIMATRRALATQRFCDTPGRRGEVVVFPDL